MLGTEYTRHWLDHMPNGWNCAYHPGRTQPYTIWHNGHVVRFEVTEEGARAWARNHQRGSD